MALRETMKNVFREPLFLRSQPKTGGTYRRDLMPSSIVRPSSVNNLIIATPPERFSIMEHLEKCLLLKKAVQDFNLKFSNQPSVTYLKQKQIETLSFLSKKKDCFVTLPTGYGKSLIYELLPFVVKDSVVLIICPLNSIIYQELSKLGNCAKPIGNIDSEVEEKTVKYIFGHPEDILKNSAYLEAVTYSSKHFFLVVDEAHCIVNWGQDFRPAFKSISDLLASLENVTILALTATSTSDSRAEIIKTLCMYKPKIINCSPVLNENIYLILRTRPPSTGGNHTVEASYELIFKLLICEMLENMENFPLTIIYTKLKWCGFGVELAHRILQEDIYSGEHTVRNCRVVQFHSPQPNQVNDHILEELRSDNPGIKMIFATIALGMGADLRHVRRVVHAGAPSSLEGTWVNDHILEELRSDNPGIKMIFATIALGMGADLRHVRRVVHAGAPSSLEDYVQEIGRAGRDGKTAEAVMFVNNTDISSRYSDTSIKEYARCETCRREFINKHFESMYVSSDIRKCCDFCEGIADIKMNVASTTQKFVLRDGLHQFVRADDTKLLIEVLNSRIIQRIIDSMEFLQSSNDIQRVIHLPQSIADSVFHLIQFAMSDE